MPVIAYTGPDYPFSGFRKTLWDLMKGTPGAFVDVPRPGDPGTGRGFNATTAAKKINLRLERDGVPYEVRIDGPAKRPTRVGLFVAGTMTAYKAPKDSASGTKRTAVNDGATNFGKEQIAPTLERYAAKREDVQAARAAEIEVKRAEWAELEAAEAANAPPVEAEAPVEEVPTEAPVEAEVVEPATEAPVEAVLAEAEPEVEASEEAPAEEEGEVVAAQEEPEAPKSHRRR
jgi:hypothetical protein